MAEELKYTQEDMNKAMANKDKEVTDKFKSQIEKLNKEHEEEITNTRKEYLSKGEERAQMSAEEKAKADYEEKMADIKNRESEIEAQKKEFAEKDALHKTKSILEEKGIPSNFANFLTDIDEAKRDEKIASFEKDYQSSIDKKVEDTTKGDKSPQNGSNISNPNSITAEKFKDMSMEEQNAIYMQSPELYEKLSEEAYK